MIMILYSTEGLWCPGNDKERKIVVRKNKEKKDNSTISVQCLLY